MPAGEEPGKPQIPDHEHPEILARIDDIEAVISLIDELVENLQARLRDMIGQSVQGVADQIAFFDAADHLTGSTALVFTGGDTLDAADGPMTIASGGLPVIDIDNTGVAPMIGFLGADPIEQPTAADIDELLIALEDLGLISTS